MGSTARFSRTRSKFLQLGGLAPVVALILCTSCRGGPSAVLSQLDEGRRLTADFRVQLAKAADASTRAVLAETDEASKAFAADAEQSKHNIDADAAALTPLLSQLGFAEEVRLMGELSKQLTAYEALDHDILALAVENTNLKAQRLSFGPAREAADSFRAALTAASAAAPAADQCRVQTLAAQAALAVREIEVLQAPHIAEADDAAMSRLETTMASLGGQAKGALAELSKLVEPKVSLGAARTALDQFNAVEAQLVGLSRRNSNVRSLDLSLRAEPPLIAACDNTAHTLQDTLAKEISTATK